MMITTTKTTPLTRLIINFNKRSTEPIIIIFSKIIKLITLIKEKLKIILILIKKFI